MTIQSGHNSRNEMLEIIYALTVKFSLLQDIYCEKIWLTAAYRAQRGKRQREFSRSSLRKANFFAGICTQQQNSALCKLQQKSLLYANYCENFRLQQMTASAI